MFQSFQELDIRLFILVKAASRNLVIERCVPSLRIEIGAQVFVLELAAMTCVDGVAQDSQLPLVHTIDVVVVGIAYG